MAKPDKAAFWFEKAPPIQIGHVLASDMPGNQGGDRVRIGQWPPSQISEFSGLREGSPSQKSEFSGLREGSPSQKSEFSGLRDVAKPEK